MTDIMVDLETLDTRQTATILSIGACRIDWTTGEIVDPFYIVVDSQSCLDIGLTESASTRQFWDRQPDEARKVFTDPNVPIHEGLRHFERYLRSFGIKSVELWGNGSDFDNTILTNAYDKCGLRAPWMFYNNRCFRTLRKTVGRNVIEPVREGTHHNALDDAIYQAKILLGLEGPDRPMNISELRDRKLKLKDDLQVLIETFIAETGVYPEIDVAKIEMERISPEGPVRIPIVNITCII